MKLKKRGKRGNGRVFELVIVKDNGKRGNDGPFELAIVKENGNGRKVVIKLWKTGMKEKWNWKKSDKKRSKELSWKIKRKKLKRLRWKIAEKKENEKGWVKNVEKK